MSLACTHGSESSGGGGGGPLCSTCGQEYGSLDRYAPEGTEVKLAWTKFKVDKAGDYTVLVVSSGVHNL